MHSYNEEVEEGNEEENNEANGEENVIIVRYLAFGFVIASRG